VSRKKNYRNLNQLSVPVSQSVMSRIDLGKLFHSLIVLQKNDCKWDVVDTGGRIN